MIGAHLVWIWKPQWPPMFCLIHTQKIPVKFAVDNLRSPGGLALELFQSVPYGKRAILVAKQKNVDELFNAVSYLIDRRRTLKTCDSRQPKGRR